MSCIQKVVVRGLPADGWRGRAVIRRAAKCRSLLAAGSRNNVYSGRARPGAECCILWHSRPGGSRWSGRGLQRSPPAPSIRAPNKSEDTAIRHRQALNSRPRARGVEFGTRPGWRKGFPAPARLVPMQERTCSGAISPADLRDGRGRRLSRQAVWALGARP